MQIYPIQMSKFKIQIPGCLHLPHIIINFDVSPIWRIKIIKIPSQSEDARCDLVNQDLINRLAYCMTHFHFSLTLSFAKQSNLPRIDFLVWSVEYSWNLHKKRTYSTSLITRSSTTVECQQGWHSYLLEIIRTKSHHNHVSPRSSFYISRPTLHDRMWLWWDTACFT